MQARGAAPAAAQTALTGVPTLGVSLAALRAFVAQHAGRAFRVEEGPPDAGGDRTLPFEALTTAQVVHAVVKPATARAGPGGTPCSYVEMLLAQGARDALARPHAARATRFVSHAWSYLFCDLVAALEAHAPRATAPRRAPRRGRRGAPAAAVDYLWLDVFVGNQHLAAELPQVWWSGAFAHAVADIGHTLAVLQPWHAPAPLRRSWCLWELFNTVDSGARLDLVLSRAQGAQFQHALVHDLEAVTLALGEVDMRRATAFFERDRRMIAAAVEASPGGFDAVNRRIADSLREWLLEQGDALLRLRTAALGREHPDTQAAQRSLAELAQRLQRPPLPPELLALRRAQRDAQCRAGGEPDAGEPDELAAVTGAVQLAALDDNAPPRPPDVPLVVRPPPRLPPGPQAYTRRGAALSDEDARLEWRRYYTMLIRGPVLANPAVLRAPGDATRCAFQLRALPREQLEVHQLVQGQLVAHALLSCPAAHAFVVSQLVRLDPARMPPVHVLSPLFDIHNDAINLAFVEHRVFLRATGAIDVSLRRLLRGQPLPGGLRAALEHCFAARADPAEPTAEEARALAAGVMRTLREAVSLYVRRLSEVAPDAFLDAEMRMPQPAARRAAADAYAALGRELARVCADDLRIMTED